MIKKIFSVYDVKSELFSTPFMLNTLGEAERAFTDSVNTPECPWHTHPEDYTLFNLGEFDENTAQYNILAAPLPLGKAVNFKKAQSAIG